MPEGTVTKFGKRATNILIGDAVVIANVEAEQLAEQKRREAKKARLEKTKSIGRVIATAHHPWAPPKGQPGLHEGDDFLSFPKGARIEVVKRGEDGGWWDGRYDGKRGWFPSSFCDISGPSSPPNLSTV